MFYEVHGTSSMRARRASAPSPRTLCLAALTAGTLSAPPSPRSATSAREDARQGKPACLDNPDTGCESDHRSGNRASSAPSTARRTSSRRRPTAGSSPGAVDLSKPSKQEQQHLRRGGHDRRIRQESDRRDRGHPQVRRTGGSAPAEVSPILKVQAYYGENPILHPRDPSKNQQGRHRRLDDGDVASVQLRRQGPANRDQRLGRSRTAEDPVSRRQRAPADQRLHRRGISSRTPGLTVKAVASERKYAVRLHERGDPLGSAYLAPRNN